MAYLSKHYLDKHPNMHNFIYFCVYCGQYFTNFKALKLHKFSHNLNMRKHVDSKLQKKMSSLKMSPRRKSTKIVEASTPEKSSFTKVSPLKKKPIISPKRKSSTQNPTVDRADNEARAETLNAISGISSLSTKSEKQRPCPLSKKNLSQNTLNGQVQINVVQSYMETIRQKPCPLSKKIQLLGKTFNGPCPLSKKLNGLSQDDLMSSQKTKSFRDFKVPVTKLLPNNSITDLQNEKYSSDKPSISSKEFPEIGKKIMKRRLTCQ